jgi:DNA recombination protein Rad52
MNWETASKELAKPLGTKHVKQREQAGRKLSYIEGWHAIAEANRIFGFDGWARETLSMDCVSEKARKVGRHPHQRDGWGVTYTAKVRVTVDSVTREGYGTGHGIDVDLGQAHESAVKEAETDAKKRAMMTIGNPFGLALYDKEQAHVSDNPDAPPPMSTDDIANEINTGIANCVNWGNLEAYWTSPQTQADLNRLKKEAPETLDKLVTVMKQRKAQIADNHQVEHAKGQAA